MNRQRRMLAVSIAGTCTCLLSGCVVESRSGDTSTFAYELWVPLTALAAGLIAIAVAAVVRKKNLKIAIGSGLVGFSAVAVVAPSLMLDRAVVSPESIVVRTGIWGSTAGGSVRLADVNSARLIRETSRRRGGGNGTSDYLIVGVASGGTRIPLNNKVCAASAERMLAAIASRGIMIEDQR